MVAPMNHSNGERVRKKDRNTERARDRNRAIKLSVAPLAVTNSRVNVAWPCQQMDRLVLMFYSSTNGEI